MPKSRTHYKRKMTKRKRKEKFESLIQKRLDAFKALPLADQVALMDRWKGFSTNALRSGAAKNQQEDPTGVVGPREEGSE